MKYICIYKKFIVKNCKIILYFTPPNAHLVIGVIRIPTNVQFYMVVLGQIGCSFHTKTLISKLITNMNSCE